MPCHIPLLPHATTEPSAFRPRLCCSPPAIATKPAFGAGTLHCPMMAQNSKSTHPAHLAFNPHAVTDPACWACAMQANTATPHRIAPIEMILCLTMVPSDCLQLVNRPPIRPISIDLSPLYPATGPRSRGKFEALTGIEKVAGRSSLVAGVIIPYAKAPRRAFLTGLTG
jgi:hypothetical protein